MDTTVCVFEHDRDEVARDWVAGTLPEGRVAEFDVHVRSCALCQRSAARAVEVTASLRAAARHAPSSPMRRLAHSVADQARAIVDSFRPGNR